MQVTLFPVSPLINGSAPLSQFYVRRGNDVFRLSNGSQYSNGFDCFFISYYVSRVSRCHAPPRCPPQGAPVSVFSTAPCTATAAKRCRTSSSSFTGSFSISICCKASLTVAQCGAQHGAIRSRPLRECLPEPPAVSDTTGTY